MKKVAIMINNMGGGGTQRVVSNISMHRNDPEMPIIIFDDFAGSEYCGKIAAVPNWYDKRNKISSKILSKLIYPVYFPFIVRMRVSFIRKYKKRTKIDAAISMTKRMNIYNVRSKAAEKAIISVHEYGQVARPGELLDGIGVGDKEKRKLIRYYRKADLVIAVSGLIKERLITDYGINPEKVKVIYNPHDLEDIRRQSKEELPEKHRALFTGTVFIAMGHLRIWKGQHHMIRAFSEVKKAISDAKLIILGSGPMRGELEALIVGFNLHGSIVILDYLQNPFKYLANSTVLINSSLSEGFPNALIEALACGLPVISTDCYSGPREILAPGTSYNQELTDMSYEEYGVLCPRCDGVSRSTDIPLTTEEQALAKAMISLAQDEEKRKMYSKKGQARVQEFDVKEIMPKYMEIFETT